MQTAIKIRTEDHLWAGHVVLPPQLGLGGAGQPAAVSVLARGVAFGEVTLSLVHDLRPFAAAADDWFREMAAREAARPHPIPAAPSGVDGHQRLLDYLLAGLPNPRARHPRAPVGQHAALWESAVLGQMRLAGQSRQDANHAVTLMVNQVLRLADTAPWADDGVAANAECIRYTAFDSDVSSRRAQLAWPAVFTPNRPRPADRAGFRRFVAETLDAERAWLEAWNTWHATRHPET